jgi:hypothetical protein
MTRVGWSAIAFSTVLRAVVEGARKNISLEKSRVVPGGRCSITSTARASVGWPALPPARPKPAEALAPMTTIRSHGPLVGFAALAGACAS